MSFVSFIVICKFSFEWNLFDFREFIHITISSNMKCILFGMCVHILNVYVFNWLFNMI